MMFANVFRRRRAEDAAKGLQGPEEVVVADDDDLVRELVLTALARARVSARGATDGQAALATVRDQQPKILLLDWLMPRLNGLEVCRALKADPITSALHVVMLTSRGEEEQVLAAFDAGADDYVTKPFDVEEVVGVVQRVLGWR